MVLFVLMPLWLGLSIWGLCALLGAGKSAAPGTRQRTIILPKTVQRTITAPDGRTATFIVPVDEPASVSIARMYPPGQAPQPVAGEPDFVNPLALVK